jgi:tetratricopeptide (TPR) repeat protein
MIRAVLIALLLLVPFRAALAESPPEALAERAVQAYTAALDARDQELRLNGFRRAELLFSKLFFNDTATAEIYTNLGNAALQAEHVGHAVLAYRRALRLDPDHARARQNLAHARSRLPVWVPRPDEGGLLDTFFFWHRTLSRSERWLAAALLFAGAMVLLAASIRFKQPLLRNLAVISGVGWLALLASLFVEAQSGEGTEAVVTAEEVVARAADSALAPSPFAAPLPAGTELRVIERRLPWVRVRLANGSDAWLNETSITPIVPDA